MTVRLFGAVVAPPEIIEELDSYVAPRREADERLRWMPNKTWHLTTLFAEAVDDDDLDPLLDALGDVAAGQPAFDVVVAGAGAFPNPIQTQSLYLAVGTGSDELAHLSRTGRAAASRVGVRPDGTKYVPHLTLARTRTRFESTRWLGIIDSFGEFGWHATELVVHQSTLHNQGGHRHTEHQVLRRCPLGVGTSAR